jgi:hypothetical protein
MVMLYLELLYAALFAVMELFMVLETALLPLIFSFVGRFPKVVEPGAGDIGTLGGANTRSFSANGWFGYSG